MTGEHEPDWRVRRRIAFALMADLHALALSGADMSQQRERLAVAVGSLGATPAAARELAARAPEAIALIEQPGEACAGSRLGGRRSCPQGRRGP